MGEGRLKGKGLNATAKDVADGFFFLNPTALKNLEPEGFKTLHHELKKIETGIHGETFPFRDTEAIRRRNTNGSTMPRLFSNIVLEKKK